MEPRSCTAVIFDVDGTLVDSTPGIIRAWTQWAIEFGITQEQLANLVGHSSKAIIRQLLPESSWHAAGARIDELEVFEAHDTNAARGASEAIATVGEKAAIATSGIHVVATARLAAAGITPPSIMVTSDDVEHAKPAPDLFLEAARRLGVDPADCLVIEDAPAGVAAAKAAGCAVIAVPTTVSPEHLDCPVAPSFAHIDFSRDGDRIIVSIAKSGERQTADIR